MVAIAASGKNQAEVSKRERNSRSLTLAKHLLQKDFNTGKKVRVICECMDFACNELIEVNFKIYNAAKDEEYFILAKHNLSHRYQILSKEKNYYKVKIKS